MKFLIEVTGQWANKTFPKSNNKSIISHLREEVDELDIAMYPLDRAEEAADIFLLLAHYCYKNDIDLEAEAITKLNINMDRTWETDDNGRGHWKHLEE